MKRLLALALLLGCNQSATVTSTKKPRAGHDAGADTSLSSGVDAKAPDPVPVGPDSGDAPVPPAEMTCQTAAQQKGNAGCRFYAVQQDSSYETDSRGACFAIFVVNQGDQPVRLTLDRAGTTFPLGPLARLPRGSGPKLTYEPFNESVGLPAGEIAILFLAHDPMSKVSPCPPGVTTAVKAPAFVQHPGVGKAFRLTSDRPVVAYQIWPYGGGPSAITAATLLLPEESWGQSYIGVNPGFNSPVALLDVVAKEDGTQVTLRPSIDVQHLGPVPATAKGMTGTFTLNAGEFVEILQPPITVADLSGSLLTSNKPVGLFGGTTCLGVPANKAACDSAQQQLPPSTSLGQEYAAVRYRSRAASEESVPWRFVGAADGTTLTYDRAPMGAPTTLARGQVVDVWTDQPFVVRSQDAAHPFYLAGYMTGGQDFDHAGDPDFVNVVPTSQYLAAYVFFTDPTYPETNLVLVRKRGADGKFADVRLDCAAAPLGGWTALGDFEFTRADLSTGNFQPVIPGCDNGRHKITSEAPFAVTVWGWGSKATGGTGKGDPRYTEYVSYAYPAGAGVAVVNNVVIK
jgi:hypothetical protein